MPVPPIYLRDTQNEAKTKTIHQVVDGQQRIKSVLEFMDGQFRLSKSLRDAPWASKKFSDLSQDEQAQIRGFVFPIQIFKGISDELVLEIFARLNTYSVPLNKQELRNGRFFGFFKQLSDELARKYLGFWRKHKVFTEQAMARMLEVELTSELLIAGNSGMQDKKGSLDKFYSEFDDEYPKQKVDEKRFHETMAAISDTFPEEGLGETEFHRAPMFYTLYCVVYHHLYGLQNEVRKTPARKLTADERGSLRDAVLHLSEILAQAKEAQTDPEIEIPGRYEAFILAVRGGQTDNIKPRQTRFNTLFSRAF